MGRLLHTEGFANIQGGDATSQFVEKAGKSGWYSGGTRELWFGRGVDQLPKDLIKKFDCVIASGVFLEGHIPNEGFDDAHAMCKTGGYFVTSIR